MVEVRSNVASAARGLTTTASVLGIAEQLGNTCLVPLGYVRIRTARMAQFGALRNGDPNGSPHLR